MELYHWNKEKNQKLVRERHISFEEVISHIENGYLLDIIAPSMGKHSGQRQFVIEIRGYVYLVPFADSGEGVFLKTIIPSRKLTKRYLKGRKI